MLVYSYHLWTATIGHRIGISGKQSRPQVTFVGPDIEIENGSWITEMLALNRWLQPNQQRDQRFAAMYLVLLALRLQ